MIAYVETGTTLTLAYVNSVEDALGVPRSAPGATARDFWDPIAHACNLPDVDALQRGMDGPGVLPAPVWNAAVRIANTKGAAKDVQR